MIIGFTCSTFDLLHAGHIQMLRAVGIEYMNKNFTGKQICKDRGIDIYYNKRDHKFSSTELRQRIIRLEDEKILR